MKRLSGWDAVLLYSETPTVHMHTLKLAVIDISDDSKGRHFGVDEFRQVIHGRLHKLDPFRYELVDIPFKFHHPMWRENCEVDLEYHVRPYRVDSPGGRRELDDAVGKIASTPLDRSQPAVGDVLHRGPGQRHGSPCSARSTTRWPTASPRRICWRAAWTCRPAPATATRTQPIPRRAAPSWCARRSPTTCARSAGCPGVMRYTAQGMSRVRKSPKKLSPELTRPFTPPPSFMNHMVDGERKFATATLALADVKQTAKHLGVTINDMVLAISAGALRKLLAEVRRPRRPSAVGFRPSQFRLLARPHLGQLLHRRHDGAAHRTRRSAGARAGRARCRGVDAKETHHLMGPELVSRWSAYFPPAPAEALFRWLANKDGQNKVLNLPISNVPGPREHGRVGGALVTEIYSVGPLTTGSGLNITVWSYVDQLNVSVLSDGATLRGSARTDRRDDRGVRRNPPCRWAFRGADRRREARWRQ